MTTAIAFLDWISYTRMNDAKLLEYPSEFDGLAREVLWEWQRYNETEDAAAHAYVTVKSNKPFRHARQDSVTGARIEWGGGSDRVLCSFSGQGCRHLRARNRTQTVLKNVCSDVSRLDFTVDLKVATQPIDFCGIRDKKKHKTGAYMFSEEGQTQYVGSWSSDRFARVYRYNPPHERAEFLRVEHVFKGKQAKAIASKLVDVAPSAIVEAVGAIYGWAHADWLVARGLSATPEDVLWYKEEKHPSKTLKWLQETCVPAMIRLYREGEIVDLREWMEANIYAKMMEDGRDLRAGTDRPQE